MWTQFEPGILESGGLENLNGGAVRPGGLERVGVKVTGKNYWKLGVQRAEKKFIRLFCLNIGAEGFEMRGDELVLFASDLGLQRNPSAEEGNGCVCQGERQVQVEVLHFDVRDFHLRHGKVGTSQDGIVVGESCGDQISSCVQSREVDYCVGLDGYDFVVKSLSGQGVEQGLESIDNDSVGGGSDGSGAQGRDFLQADEIRTVRGDLHGDTLGSARNVTRDHFLESVGDGEEKLQLGRVGIGGGSNYIKEIGTRIKIAGHHGYGAIGRTGIGIRREG